MSECRPCPMKALCAKAVPAGASGPARVRWWEQGWERSVAFKMAHLYLRNDWTNINWGPLLAAPLSAHASRWNIG